MTLYEMFFKYINMYTRMYVYLNRAQIIKDMHEQIRLEKYQAEKQALLEEQEAIMRKVQLEETLSVFHDYITAFLEYVEIVEEEENVSTVYFSFSTFILS